jgi:hypothetical protein
MTTTNGSTNPVNLNGLTPDETLQRAVTKLSANPVYGASSPTFITPTTDYAGIMAARNAAVAAGGGIVQYLPVTYNIQGNTIPLDTNVWHIGAGPQVQYQGTVSKGSTIINGNGTAIAFGFNTSDSGVSPTGNWINGSVTNTRVVGMVIQNFTYGVKVGAQNMIGCSNSRFQDLVILDCSQWGFYQTNFLLSQFHNIRAERCAVGGIGFVNWSNNYYNGGNSDCSQLAVNAITNKSRGIMLKAWDGALNQINSVSNSSFGSGQAAIAITATSNTTATVQPDGFTLSQHLSVPDASIFAPDMPVWFSNGLSPVPSNNLMFVGLVDTTLNRITVTNQVGGTPYTFTTASTDTLNSSGFPKMEFIGMYAGAGQVGAIQSCKFAGNDLEIPTSAITFMQGSSGLIIENEFTSVTDKFGIVGINAANGKVFLALGGNINFDNACNSTEVTGGAHTILGSCWGMGVRQLYESSLTSSKGIATGIAGAILNIRSYKNGLAYPDFYINNQTNMLGLGRGLVVTQIQFPTATDFNSFLPNSPAYNYVYSGAGGGTATLPTIAASGTGQNAGLVMCITNPSTGTLTLTPAASQLIDNAVGATSLIMPANTSVQLIASNVGGVLYWARYK